jgi:hypothetical protein
MSLMSPYDESYQKQMDAFQEGLWRQLELVPTLEPHTRDAVMRYLLELACQAQNARNIVLGRAAILSLPKDWLLQHIDSYAEPLLQVDDEWEYRRLSEIYDQLDVQLVRRLAMHGRQSRNEGVNAAAQELLDWLSRKSARQ